MKFKEGISVEVLRKARDNPYGSWHSATIIAIGDGGENIIRYNFLKNERGDSVEERVAKKNIRPQPQHDQKIKKRWVVGEIAEVFDVHRWRVGKVAKVLRNEHLVVKLFGSIQLKEFHASSLRICRLWRKKKRHAFTKDQRLVPRNQQEAIRKEKISSCPEKDGHRNLRREEHDRVVLPVPMGKSKRSTRPAFNKHLGLGRRIQKKRTSEPESDGSKNNTPLSRQLGISNSKPGKETNRLFSNECSVASCSLNETADHCNLLVENGSHNCSDAESSSFPALSCKRNTVPFPRHRFEVGVDLVHNLELQAYKSTVRALHASGPLSWEQESLLTNLRLSLHISNDEHLLQLRHLLAA